MGRQRSVLSYQAVKQSGLGMEEFRNSPSLAAFLQEDTVSQPLFAADNKRSLILFSDPVAGQP